MGRCIKIIDYEEGIEFEKATQRIHELIGRNNINRKVENTKQEVKAGDRSKQNDQSHSRSNRTYTSGDKRYIKSYNKSKNTYLEQQEQDQYQYFDYDIVQKYMNDM
jgi:hypothetical protein